MSERAYALRVVGVALVLLFGPFLWLAVSAPAGTTYTGLAYYPGDSFWYLGALLHGHLGELLYRDSFTYLQLPQRLVGPLWLAVGHLVFAAGPVPQGLALQAFRLLAFLVFCWQAWRLLAAVLPMRATRRVAFAFLLLTSGLGWFVTVLGAHPAHGVFDLELAESSTFFTLMFPGGALVLLLMVLYLRALFEGVLRRGSWRWCGVGAASVALLSTLHLEKVAVLGAGTALYLAWLGLAQRRPPRSLVRPAVMSILMLSGALPYAIYTVTTLVPDPVLASLLVRSHLHPPVADPFFYVFGYGLPGLLAVAALTRFLKRWRGAGASTGAALLWAMLVPGLVLLLTPGSLVDHRGEGLQLVLAPLAAVGLLQVALPWVRRRLAPQPAPAWRRARGRAINVVLILGAPTVLYLSLSGVALGRSERNEVYVSNADSAALAWLRDHGTPGQVVIGGPESDEFVVAYSGLHAAWGDYAWTPDFDAEGLRLLAFLKGESDPRVYLAARHVDYLYWGPREASVATIEPRSFVFLRPVFSAGDTVLYRFVACEPECGVAGHAPSAGFVGRRAG